jgi:RimJ/RimL family protein N-acetyltransferase
MSQIIPTLKTPRLSLRAMQAGDFDRFAEIWATPEVVRYITGTPRSRERSWDAFLQNAGHWQIKGFGYWALQPHDADHICGQTGFFLRNRDLGAGFDGCPEAGWVMAPEVQGRGLGLEAVQTAHDWFDQAIGGASVCIIAPENERSLKLADRLGYRSIGEAEVDGGAVVMLRRDGAA